MSVAVLGAMFLGGKTGKDAVVDVEITYSFVRDQDKRLKVREIDLAKTDKTIDGERPGDYWRRQLQ